MKQKGQRLLSLDDPGGINRRYTRGTRGAGFVLIMAPLSFLRNPLTQPDMTQNNPKSHIIAEYDIMWFLSTFTIWQFLVD